MLSATYSGNSWILRDSLRYTVPSFRVLLQNQERLSSRLTTSRVSLHTRTTSQLTLNRMHTGNAFLAQSPQLAKQMAIAADFERVYEIGPVFRAENSNTHRHMTEFIGLDLEMAIEEHYHEVMELLDSLFIHMFRGLRDKYKNEIETVRKAFPADEFKWRDGPEGTLKLTFRQAVDLLVEDGVAREALDDIESVFNVTLDGLIANILNVVPRTRSVLEESSRPSTTPTTSSLTSSPWVSVLSTLCPTLRTLYVSPGSRICPSSDMVFARRFPILTTSSCAGKKSCLAHNVSTTLPSSSRR